MQLNSIAEPPQLTQLLVRSPAGVEHHPVLLYPSRTIDELLIAHTDGIVRWGRQFSVVWLVGVLEAGGYPAAHIRQIIERDYPAEAWRYRSSFVQPGGGGARGTIHIIKPCPDLATMQPDHGICAIDTISDEGDTLAFLKTEGHLPSWTQYDYLFQRPDGPKNQAAPRSLCAPMTILRVHFVGESEECDPFILGLGTDYNKRQWTRKLSAIYGVPWKSILVSDNTTS